MQLNNEMKKAAFGRIGSVWTKEKSCIICGQEKWSMSDKIFSLNQFGVNQKQNQIIPLIVLICSNCGNTISFNAITLGFKFDKKN